MKITPLAEVPTESLSPKNELRRLSDHLFHSPQVSINLGLVETEHMDVDLPNENFDTTGNSSSLIFSHSIDNLAHM